jgi:hypothetical protein
MGLRKIDKALGYVFFGFILFITCFCAGWWIDVGLGGSALIGCIACSLAGIGINILLLRRIVERMFTLHPALLAIAFGLYSVGIFGFFMGVPVFNALMGVFAGWYVGRRAKLMASGREGLKKPLNKAVLFSTAVLAAFCVASAWLALADSTTAANLEGMLGLGFHLTQGMIWGIILMGGAMLLAMQALAAKVAARVAYRIV